MAMLAACAWRLTSRFRGLPGQDASFPEADTLALNPRPICFREIQNLRQYNVVLWHRSMERIMITARPRQMCHPCNRIVPRAARRCLWCGQSTILPTTALPAPELQIHQSPETIRREVRS